MALAGASVVMTDEPVVDEATYERWRALDCCAEQRQSLEAGCAEFGITEPPSATLLQIASEIGPELVAGAIEHACCPAHAAQAVHMSLLEIGWMLGYMKHRAEERGEA